MEPIHRHRLVHTSLVRSLLKAAKRIDADPALRALLTTPAEYANMYNHYGERWEGPLLQLHDKRRASLDIDANASAPPMPVSHPFFSFLQSLNGGKSFFNPLDDAAKKLVYPEVVRRVRALSNAWKESTGHTPEVIGDDTKLLSAAFFAMKCTKSVLDVVPLVETTQARHLKTQEEPGGKTVKGKKHGTHPDLNPLIYHLPSYLKSTRVLRELPLIHDGIEAHPSSPHEKEPAKLSESDKRTRKEKGAKAGKAEPSPSLHANNAAHFLVAHPMLDQCFRHAIILISAHKPTSAGGVVISDGEVSPFDIADTPQKIAVSLEKPKSTRGSGQSLLKHRLKSGDRTPPDQQEPESSMGWVINIPIRAKNGDPLRVHDLKLEDHDEIFNECLYDNIVFSGGPVGSPTMMSNRSHHALFLLYCGSTTMNELSRTKASGEAKSGNSGPTGTNHPKILPVAPGVHSICDLPFLQEHVKAGRIHPREVLVILGYSGWGKAQLEGEILQGTWFTAAMDNSSNIQSLLLSYQKNDTITSQPVEQHKAEQASCTKTSSGGKSVTHGDGTSGMILKASQRSIADFSEKTRTDLFVARTQSATSTVPFPVKMWSDVLHSMGPDYVAMSRLSAVLPLRVMSP